MADETKTIGLGLVGGAATTLKLDQAELDKLIAAIQAGDQWVEVNDEKRVIHLRADHVEFYALDKEDQEERRAGF